MREIGLSLPTFVNITYSMHFCERCRKHFTPSMEHLAFFRGKFTSRVRRTAVAMAATMSLAMAADEMFRRYRVRVPISTLHEWVGSEKREMAAGKNG